MGGCSVPGWVLGTAGGMVLPSIDGREMSVYKFISSWNLSNASWIAFRNVSMATCWNMGASWPRKSAPTRLKESPKYMHWPSRESKRLPTPRWRSRSRVSKNCAACCTTHPWKMALSFNAWPPGGSNGSSSENMARYWVMMSKRCTRQVSMVLLMWKYGSSSGMAARMDRSQLPRACRNLTRSSASVKTSILRRYPITRRQTGSCVLLRSCWRSWFSMSWADSRTSCTIP